MIKIDSIDYDFIKNQEIVLNIIDILKDKFTKEIYFKYNHHIIHSAESYYYTGHAPSFSRILYEIYDGDGTFYEDFSFEGENIGHTLIKIGEHFYDVCKIADEIVMKNPQQFSECPANYFPFYEENYGSKEEHNDEIEQELIAIGKIALQEMIQNHSTEYTRNLVHKKQQSNN